jgi:hypothetical protein
VNFASMRFNHEALQRQVLLTEQDPKSLGG